VTRALAGRGSSAFQIGTTQRDLTMNHAEDLTIDGVQITQEPLSDLRGMAAQQLQRIGELVDQMWREARSGGDSYDELSLAEASHAIHRALMALADCAPTQQDSESCSRR
jgi:hypothetical protein